MKLIPSDKGVYFQSNVGESKGNILASFGIDLISNRGKLQTSGGVIKAITDADNADFSGYAGAIAQYGTSTIKTFAISGKAFSATDITGTWTEETSGVEPDSGNTIMDAVYFDGLLLVSEATDIKAYNGTTWSSWWQGTKGQTALTSGQRHLMEVGPQGDLFIVDEGNLVYRVTKTSGGVSKTGDGTLDFSDTNFLLSTLDSSANRMWISAVDRSAGEHAIIEWDMSPSSPTANNIHRIGNAAARCIAIWNDTPIALLQDGRVIYYDGTRFKDWPDVRMPIARDVFLDDDFVHPNGWAIIDGMPHFLLAGRVDGNTPAANAKSSYWACPAGVYCLDPEFGFYHRYAISIGTGNDFGQQSITATGALYALKNDDSKFLASYEYLLQDGSSTRSILAYHDKNKTNSVKSFLASIFVESLGTLWSLIQVFHKTLMTANDSISIYYRTDNTDPTTLDGVWLDTDTLNVTATNTGVEKGDMALVKYGIGAGTWLKVASVDESSTVTSITFDQALSVAANDTTTIDVFKFISMGTINNTTRDFEKFTIPQSKRKRKVQILLVMETDSKIELDNVIIDT